MARLYPPFYPPKYPSAAATSIVSPQVITPTAITPQFEDARSGDAARVSASGRDFLYVRNSGPNPITLSVVTPQLVDGDLEVADREIVVPVGGEGVMVPLGLDLYGDRSKTVTWSYSSRSGVTRAVLKR